MSLSKNLLFEFRQLQILLSTEPRKAWLTWIDVRDDIGQNMIILLDNLVRRGTSGHRKIDILRYRAYEELAKVASLMPWSELIRVCEKRETIRIVETVSKDMLVELTKIMEQELHAIE